MTANAQFAGLDRFKIVAALLVIAILTGPLISYSPYADFVLAGIAARVAVPFFFIASGFLLFRKLTGEKARDRGLLLVRQTGGSGTALSGMMSFGVAFFLRRLQQSAPDQRRRAWAEIRLDDVTHNVRELRGLLPPDCELMAVVKADAYGHGSIPVARHLSRIGVRHFAVADVEEGIALRREGIKGEILVLGYTSPARFGDLARYRLSQTVISADYGKALNGCGKPMKVHIKIDTGMSRLGERWTDMEAIRSMYRLRNLRVTGTFTHLSCSDSLAEADIAFTNAQIKRFGETIDEIKAAGLDPGTLHMQSSYGIVNYSELRCGLARPGIALFGLLGTERDQAQAPIDLRPALSWRARVTLVKQMQAIEPVGYGRNYTTRPGSVIATVSIGYADGVPRVLAEKGGAVLIRGHRAPIAGNICMDQLMVDVTHIEGVQEGDTVTLIGQDGQASITAGEMARRCGTITNEIVSRIGQRVDRIYL
ncbi:serine racemase VanT catalytic subunit [Paenibacillus thiaminolyticus]|uniref:serine racemase VanT catalytic subunit n=1 Tax=Paenibacillus thiaminolyticus TaxID=49283 RepID=UPI00235035B7|nr:serine racemase VanT catalytic subunit [Paenibacillus thiaminolyticus]WCR28799.1 serine racemase VanT catalytic subunit [Paenibacillus thiaminolyticus]